MRPSHLPAILLPILCSCGLAHAHGLFVHYDIPAPDRIIISAFWQADEPAAQASVRMLDPNGATIAAGRTDARGQCTFAVPEPLAYRFEVTVAGHRAECRLTPEAVALLEPQDRSNTGTRPPGRPLDAQRGRDDDPGAAESVAATTSAAHAAPTGKPVVGHSEPWFASGLFSGLALVLAAAAFIMTLSLRREVRSLKCRTGGERE